ncbi:hypothetical protein CHRY9390_02417 [Chryseobacterium aquaeductus]|uniref:Uncharacterized protein n=2 Tax=Chryseobacterium aquaeductus TaxID=2675056 RepID=A0A9N8MPU4_9FLAO|nr:hypothetical protein CHRY9390_02417 [Chryseobacterium potabilaquae]CAD7811797.1 hypothetical protein CHRY9390_02417 [Chryseobacterium aquaeductus]
MRSNGLPAFCYVRRLVFFLFALSSLFFYPQSFSADTTKIYINSESTFYVQEGTTVSNYHPVVISENNEVNNVDLLVDEGTSKKHFKSKEKYSSQKIPAHKTKKKGKDPVAASQVQTQDQNHMFSLSENNSCCAVLASTFVFKLFYSKDTQYLSWSPAYYKKRTDLLFRDNDSIILGIPFKIHTRPPPSPQATLDVTAKTTDGSKAESV